MQVVLIRTARFSGPRALRANTSCCDKGRALYWLRSLASTQMALSAAKAGVATRKNRRTVLTDFMMRSLMARPRLRLITLFQEIQHQLGGGGRVFLHDPMA